MKKILIITTIALSVVGHAQVEKKTIVFPEELETELALSSLPDHLRDGAGVYLFNEDKGYFKKKESSNGFFALVERVPEFPDAFAPVSFDAEGVRTHIPRILDRGKWIAEGKSAKEIKRLVADRFANNTYSIPQNPGISYMLSPTNILPSPTGKVALYYPHYMIYASFAKSEDLGFDKFHWHTAAPMLLDGGPHGLIVIRVGDSETKAIRETQKDLIAKVEKHLGKKISSYEIAKSHNH